MIDKNEILNISNKADIVDIIESYITVTKKGKNFISICPFHSDTNPSMVISREKQIFNCFSCNTGGNVFTFVMKYENVSFKEAIKIVADKIGYALNTNNLKTFDKYDKEYNIMNLSEKFYINNLNTKDGINAKKYLSERGITDEIIKLFKIGFATGEKDSLINFFKNQNINLKDLEKLGLINVSGISNYDFFQDRILFPIANMSGQVVGFSGRLYKQSEAAKYVNSKETEIFKKSNILYNYHNAKNGVRDAKKVIVVEGFMDAIKMVAYGIKNVIATMGTALTNEHISALKKLNVPIILLFDSDNAGEEATLKNGFNLLKEKCSVEVIRLSDAKDPDEYIEKFGIKALENNISKPLKFLDFKINTLKNNYNLESSDELALFIKEVIKVLNFVDDVTKKIIVNNISKEYNLDEKILTDELDIPKIITIPPPKEEFVIKPKKQKYKNLANMILFYIVSDYHYLKIYKEDLNFFKDKDERMLASEIENYYKLNEKGSLADFLNYIMKEEKLHLKTLELINDCANEVLEQDKFLEYLDNIKRAIENDDINDLKVRIKAELDIDKKIKLMERLTKIKKGSVNYERDKNV